VLYDSFGTDRLSADKWSVGELVREIGDGRLRMVLGASSDASNDLRFRVIVDDVFGPEDYEDQPDPLFYLTARYRRSIERMVLAAPEQYLWMHRIWKSRPRHERLNKPFPDALRGKLGALPWMDDGAVGALVERSDRDRAFLTERGLDRLP